MNKINIAELLKNCPKGMELDCTMFENCTFEGIDDIGYTEILVKTPSGQIRLTKEGCFTHNDKYAKCVIFPKDKTTWEGFVPPCKFKDGDVVTDIEGAISIYLEITTSGLCGSYISLNRYNQFVPHCEAFLKDSIRLSTEEEKARLFQAIKDNGYKWNAETKTLEKLIEPKFKVGDIVCDDKRVYRIYDIDDTHYKSTYIQGGKSLCCFFPIHTQVPDKFDITTLKPFDKVLVRETNEDRWLIDFYAFYNEIQEFSCVKGMYEQCIPYEGNEHLFLSFDDCDEYFKTWE